MYWKLCHYSIYLGLCYVRSVLAPAGLAPVLAPAHPSDPTRRVAASPAAESSVRAVETETEAETKSCRTLEDQSPSHMKR